VISHLIKTILLEGILISVTLVVDQNHLQKVVGVEICLVQVVIHQVLATLEAEMHQEQVNMKVEMHSVMVEECQGWMV
jgi:hypothetical protein